MASFSVKKGAGEENVPTLQFPNPARIAGISLLGKFCILFPLLFLFLFTRRKQKLKGKTAQINVISFLIQGWFGLI